jgi:hypothetical protein
LSTLVLVAAGLSLTPAAHATVAPSPTPAANVVVTLITGDRVAVSALPDGRPVVNPVPAAGGSTTAFQTLTSGSHLYVIPQDAAGFIGAPLDLSLFDVTALIADGYADPAKALELSVSTTAGSAAPDAASASLPGMTRVSADTLRQPRDHAVAFGAALRAQREAVDAAQSADTAAPTGHLFDGITRLALRGSTSVPPGQPAGKLHTLTVKAFDRLGRRATGSMVSVVNADNVETFLAWQSLLRGEMAYSVPVGTYTVASYITTVDAAGKVDIALVTEPEVTVTHDTVVVLDARKATRVAARTPDPTTQLIAQLALQRNSAAGVSLTTTMTVFGDTPLYATPTRPVSVGQLYFYPSARLGDATGGTKYVYDLTFPYEGTIPTDLEPVIDRGRLVTIDASYHSPQPGRGEYDARVAIMPWQTDASLSGTGLSAPLARTEYVLPMPGMLFLHFLVLDQVSFSGYLQDVLREYRPGQRVTETWAAGPMAPGIEQQPTVGQACPACRSGDTLSLALMPYTDRDGHRTIDPAVSASLELYQNDTLVTRQDSGLAELPLSPDPANYRLVLDASVTAAWWPTSTRTHTEWTYTSAERAADPLPSGWTCGGKGGSGGGRGGAPTAGGGGSTGCSFEPLLFVSYRPDAGADDVIPAGQPATVDLDVSHQRGAAATPVTALDAQVSFDDGGTWQPAPARSTGDGHYTLTYPQPALDAGTGFASLRVTARDEAGSAVTQTVTRAYPLSVTPPATGGASGGTGTGTGGTGSGNGTMRACATPAAAPYAECMAIVKTAASTLAGDAAAPVGYGPSDVQSAYKLPVDGGAGRVVAIVDAYDNPNAEADLATYRARFGLPPCTSADGCLRKVNQRGQATGLPYPSPGWGLEINLDLQAVSAACPKCRILLVEADSASLADLGPAVRTAVALGADVVSNSYGSRGEFSGEQYFEGYYHYRGVPIVVASGDYGYGNGQLLINSVSYPAASQYVIAVGGTNLRRADNGRGWSETAWDGATSGCSAYIHKPGWQKDVLCDKRTVADVAAVADPETGLAVYDSYGGWGGWLTVGGTSAAAPIVASVYALTADPSAAQYASGLYQTPGGLFDVVGGDNGTCGGTYLCQAVAGYDGPTGLGTPNGVAAFDH